MILRSEMQLQAPAAPCISRGSPKNHPEFGFHDRPASVNSRRDLPDLPAYTSVRHLSNSTVQERRPFMNPPTTASIHASDAVIDASKVIAALQQQKKDAAGADEPRLRFRRSRRTASLTGFRIRSVGAYAPEQVVTNEQLEQRYGFEEGWILRRTGIRERRFADDSQGTSDLAVAAARKAMQSAGLQAADIDLLIVGTFTPDFTCPSTACLVQDKLNLDAPAMDLQAACSGFMYSLATGAQFIATGNAKCALVIGADVNSRIVRPDDQGTAPLFGDAAGAVILEPGDTAQGLVCYQLGADGAGGCMLDRPAGGTLHPATPELIAAGQHFLQMDGRNVFKWAIQAVTDSIRTVLEQAGKTPDDVALFVLHQANIRIINHAMEELGIPAGKVFNNLHMYGNTSAASIPLALDGALQENRIQQGDLIMMCGFGAGLTWGTGLFRW